MSKEEKEYRLIPYTEDDESDKVNINQLVTTIWKGRKTILYIMLFFVMYGVLASLATPEEFTSSSTMMPNIEEGSRLSGTLQQFSGLLGNVGIDPGGDQGEIDAVLYPEIIYSTPAMYNLIYTEIYSPQLDTTLTVKEYMLEHRQVSSLAKVTGGFMKYTIHLPFTIIRGSYNLVNYLFKGGENPEEQQIVSPARLQNSEHSDDTKMQHQRLTVAEFNFIREMREQIKMERNADTGLFSVGVSLPEPEISAQVTQSVVDYLTNYITEYRTEKLVRNLEFINSSYEDSEREFEKVQEALAEFRDRNMNISTARMMAEEQRLESEYRLKFDLLNGIAQKREEARINLEEKTPVFKILEPVTIPTTRSKPARAMMVTSYALLGFFLSIFFLYLKNTFLKK